MNNWTISSIGPHSTPSVIKKLIGWTMGISLLSTLIQTFFNQFNVFPGPQVLLSLSWWGISKGYVWQPISYLFIQSSSSSGITLSYLIELFFNMYLLWIIGTQLVELKGKAAFLRFYFIIGISAGMCALFFMLITGKHAFLVGPGPSLLALLIAWSMAFPETEIWPFFLLPVKVKWIVATLVAAVLLITLSQWNIAHFILYSMTIFLGYIYATTGWGWHAPFSFTRQLDNRLIREGIKLHNYIQRWSKSKKGPQEGSKIVNIQPKLSVHDDGAFVDAMLSKILKFGENSLTREEKKRLDRISEMQRSKKP